MKKLLAVMLLSVVSTATFASHDSAYDSPDFQRDVVQQPKEKPNN